MSCRARNEKNLIKLSLSECVEFGFFFNWNIFYFWIILRDLNVDYNDDVKLNLKFLNKYFEVNNLDETLKYRQNEFKTRTEYLQKRQETLHEKEIMFKERIIR